jgi:hypothetical protein
MPAAQGLESVAEVGIGKAVGEEPEEDEGVEQGLNTLVPEAQGRGSLLGDDARPLNGVERVLAKGAIVADSLDVEETSVGFEADPPECGKVVQPFSDSEVTCVVDRGFRAKCAAFLVVLLDPRRLIVHME